MHALLSDSNHKYRPAHTIKQASRAISKWHSYYSTIIVLWPELEGVIAWAPGLYTLALSASSSAQLLKGENDGGALRRTAMRTITVQGSRGQITYQRHEDNHMPRSREQSSHAGLAPPGQWPPPQSPPTHTHTHTHTHTFSVRCRMHAWARPWHLGHARFGGLGQEGIAAHVAGATLISPRVELSQHQQVAHEQ